MELVDFADTIGPSSASDRLARVLQSSPSMRADHRLIAGLILLLSACATTSRPREYGCPVAPAAGARAAASRAGQHQTRNVIIVTIDGVRWQEVFGGVDEQLAHSAGMSKCEVLAGGELMPNLHRHFVDRGVVVGAPGYGQMEASGPNFMSLPGYEEIFTGRTSSCTSNFCDHIAQATLLDELHAEAQLSQEQIAVITSWRTIERAAVFDDRTITVSAGRNGGATRDHVRVSAAASSLLDEASASSAYPGWLDYRPDRYTGALALQYVAAERPRFLFIGLGDTDEYAHRGNYRGYVDALKAADRFVGRLMDTLATLDDYGAETTVIVTTDHGRAASFTGHGGDAPESRRVWMFVAGGAVPALGFADTERIVRLADIAPTIRRWMDLTPDGSAGAGRPLGELIPFDPNGPLLASAPH
jgi:phosphopentomutase/2,3-bisphosphoglycerate-independent phosphoglycerate mutase family metalloenzyme